jgi:hypothetical protein
MVVEVWHVHFCGSVIALPSATVSQERTLAAATALLSRVGQGCGASPF